ncbi:MULTISPECIES: alpha-galactosidase [unclassified Streptomyces]|uniref:alpha-galactosidase n=1 Tax=unclassified Streptomyces TaxID=2593676 RepID=UPI00278C4934|nr:MULTISPECIES: alpha-galactosidase [unclassified Streptomyces]
MSLTDPVQLRAAGVSLVLAAEGDGLPGVVHWGADLGDLDGAGLAALCRAVTPAPVHNEADRVVAPSLAREHAAGWNGRPGLTGHRADGTAWSPWFRCTRLDVDDRGGAGRGGRVVAHGEDADAGLALVLEVELTEEGLLRQRAEVASTEGVFVVGGLALTLPVPPAATELFDLAGRWGRERAPQRRPFTVGVHARENRRGRTGPDAPLILAAGTPGFGFRHGEVWALHVAWSGNHHTYAERLATGAAVLGGGELPLPGEIRLAPGERYTTPWVYAAYADAGLDAIAARFHGHLRAHRPRPKPRPVVLNTWEAVYFDQDLDRLTELARLGAEAGAERFVLDDGWFRHRRNDRAGLGDWYVDESVWPRGLGPLITQVRGLGMEFGLWVEPEMVNPDSDLARAHPDWLLATGGRQPLTSRHQQVLDLARPGAYTYILERLDALLTAYDISYLKWDHNRDLIDAGHGPHGTPGVHAQTRAVYRLLDEVRARHPEVEIESCSSGGLRVDLGILERTDRVWASDCIDPLERQRIQRWTAQLLPPELIGAHVGAPRSHTTGRTHDLAFRAGTALFGSFGIEWDLTTATPAERAELARWVALYKELRPLLHGGTTVRADSHDPVLAVHGVVAPDRADALFAVVQLDAPDTSVPGTVRLPGLDPTCAYRVSTQPPGDTPALRQTGPTPWTGGEPLVLSGAALAHVGVRAPALYPEQLLLIRARAV